MSPPLMVITTVFNGINNTIIFFQKSVENILKKIEKEIFIEEK